MSNYTLMGYCRFEDVLPLIECREKQNLPENPKTVIVCLFPYYAGEYPGRNVSRYAIVNDYHKVAGDILSSLTAQLKAAYPNEKFAAFVDNSPVREVHAAAACGLGAIGVHGMLIHEIFGSRVFIGSIVTSAVLKPKKREAKHCLNCGLCVSACPTKAFDAKTPLNRSLCRSHISQKKRELSDWERREIRAGGMVWGCDICADVCPMNKNTPVTPIKGFLENITPVLTRENLASSISEKPYNWRGESVVLRNLTILEE